MSMAKERILVIDDDPDTIEFLQIVFSVRGREVAGALSGADGLRLAHEQPFDLIIVDVMMPDVDGYEVCRQLRADPITANVPLTILTARGRPIDEARGLAAGANRFLIKPIGVSMLVEQVNALIAQHKAAASSAPEP
jgi:DNA-binding response OmpR family regulator